MCADLVESESACWLRGIPASAAVLTTTSVGESAVCALPGAGDVAATSHLRVAYGASQHLHTT